MSGYFLATTQVRADGVAYQFWVRTDRDATTDIVHMLAQYFGGGVPLAAESLAPVSFDHGAQPRSDEASEASALTAKRTEQRSEAEPAPAPEPSPLKLFNGPKPKRTKS